MDEQSLSELLRLAAGEASHLSARLHAMSQAALMRNPDTVVIDAAQETVSDLEKVCAAAADLQLAINFAPRAAAEEQP